MALVLDRKGRICFEGHLKNTTLEFGLCPHSVLFMECVVFSRSRNSCSILREGT
ncbi:expressed protein [Echinococcus multilocularis]|uniref:Expressed protein n=1 Tax=Echinococcus multilocularis TaxID=6211 RepID=A0A068Y300_ECHMU|nr:expressed protein [Echinococcus multilocularis]